MFWLFKKAKPDGFTALCADQLLTPYEGLLTHIHQHVGVPDSHWIAVYLSFIHNFAELVQLLPASESHHHSGTGGLLTHSLEVGLNAVKLRKGKMLPLGAAAEVIEEQKELWTYAIFTAAMLHDIGKPLTDQVITIVSEKPERIWTPLTETLSKGAIYRVSFRRGRKYRSHENVPLLLASKILPDSGMNWIASNIDVLDDWTFCLTGRMIEANTLGELVRLADQTSTAQNLSGTNNISLPSAKRIPLHQRLLTTLVHLLDEGTAVPLNRAGAAGWVFDDKLWLVSKRILDEIRKHMIEEGQTGIPSDNTRLMDELMQNSIIIPASEDRAVWKITVQVDSWKNDFTCLCFPLARLWADQTAWPSQPDNIKVLEVNATSKKDKKNTPQNSKEKTSINATNSVVPEVKAKPENIKQTESALDELPLPPGILLDDISLGENVLQAKKKEIPSDCDKPKKSKNNNTDLAKKFAEWISNSIADGSLPINVQSALVHTIGDNKDLILVSPLIFRKYAKDHDFDYTQVQHAFQSLKLHTTTNDNKNIMKFETISLRKNKPPKVLNGMLIENAEEKLGIRLPPGNIHLKRT